MKSNLFFIDNTKVGQERFDDTETFRTTIVQLTSPHGQSESMTQRSKRLV